MKCFGCTLLISFALLVPAHAEETATDSAGGVSLEDLRAFTDAWHYIKEHHVETIDDRRLLEAAMRGMLSELDPHSKWLSAEELQSLEEQASGRYGGLGVRIATFADHVQIVAVFDGGPAAEAGLETGDRIVGIDQQRLDADNISMATEWLRGEAGTDVDLSLQREGQDDILEMTLTRRAIDRSSVSSQWLGDRFVHLTISQFQQNTATQLDRVLDEFDSAGNRPSGLILDLRSNPGGMLEAAVAVADRFLSDKRIVSIEGRAPDRAREYSSGPGERHPGLPMVVLVDDQSASAAEILAGALRDHGRAMVVGERTYGKGSVQTIWPLRNDSGIRLTTALYVTPGGHQIQASGITPDVLSAPRRRAQTDPGPRWREQDREGHLPGAPEGNDEWAEVGASDPMLADAVRVLDSMQRMQEAARR